MAESWQQVRPLETEDPVRRERGRTDVVALVAGLVFVVLALVGLAGPHLDLGVLSGGGILWVLVVGAGVALLAGELRRARGRSSGG